MPSPRLNRLKSDFAAMQERYGNGGPIAIRSTQGSPPERYQIEYRLKSLELLSDGRLVERDSHIAEIVLTTDFPRLPPQCKMLTPIFHPNVNAASICIGDHWAASEMLADLVLRVGELIAFQSYNTKSPLNAEAARWTDENKTLLPIDRIDFFAAPGAQAEPVREQPQSTPPPPPPPPPPQRCVNCHASGPGVELTETSPNELCCMDCIMPCPQCTRPMLVGSSACRGCVGEIDNLVNQTRTMYAEANFERAEQTLKTVLEKTPDNQEAKNLKEKLERDKRETEDTVADINRALREKRYVYFLQLAQRLRAKGVNHPGVDDVLAKVQAKVAKIRATLGDIDTRLRRSPAEAAALCQQALQLCADLPEAETGLRAAHDLETRLKAEMFADHDRYQLLGRRNPPTPLDYNELSKLTTRVRNNCEVLNVDAPFLAQAHQTLIKWDRDMRRQNEVFAKRIEQSAHMAIVWWIALPIVEAALAILQDKVWHMEEIWPLAALKLFSDPPDMNTAIMGICIITFAIPIWMTMRHARRRAGYLKWRRELGQAIGS